MRRLRFVALVFFCLTLPSVVPGQELICELLGVGLDGPQAMERDFVVAGLLLGLQGDIARELSRDQPHRD